MMLLYKKIQNFLLEHKECSICNGVNWKFLCVNKIIPTTISIVCGKCFIEKKINWNEIYNCESCDGYEIVLVGNENNDWQEERCNDCYISDNFMSFMMQFNGQDKKI